MASEPGRGARGSTLPTSPAASPEPSRPEGVDLHLPDHVARTADRSSREARTAGSPSIPTEPGEPRPCPASSPTKCRCAGRPDGTVDLRHALRRQPPGIVEVVEVDDRASHRLEAVRCPRIRPGVEQVGPAVDRPDGKSYVYSYRRVARRPVPGDRDALGRRLRLLGGLRPSGKCLFDARLRLELAAREVSRSNRGRRRAPREPTRSGGSALLRSGAHGEPRAGAPQGAGPERSVGDGLGEPRDPVHRRPDVDRLRVQRVLAEAGVRELDGVLVAGRDRPVGELVARRAASPRRGGARP